VNDSETLRYVQQDFDSIRDALIQRIRSRWPGDWNDFSSSNLGMILVDLVAWTHTTQSFLINRQVAEMFVSTMTLRESAIRLGTLVGYRLRGPSPSKVLCEATIDSAIDNDILLNEGTLIRTSSGLPFELSATYTIYAGDTQPSETVATFDPAASGPLVVPTKVTASGGSTIIDLVDTTISLNDHVAVGQSFALTSGDDTTWHVIEQITAADGAISNNRLILSTAMEGDFDEDQFTAQVAERRVEIVQGQTVNEKFTSPASVSLGHIVKLGYTPVIDGSIAVEVNGVEWDETTSLYLSKPEDTHFTVKILPDETVLVQFGNDQFGQAIPTDATIVATYRIGGGTVGNVKIGTIGTTITGLIDGSSNPVTVSITNATVGGQGGKDKETLESARIMIPASTRANDRAVTLEDWQTLASSYTHATHGSVSYARATTKAESPLEGNIVTVYAWTTGPDGGLTNLSSALKTELKSYLMSKAMVTDYVVIDDGTSRPIPISLQFLTLPGYDVAAVKRAVNSTLTTLVAGLIPGATIVHSNLVRLLDEVKGVDHVDMSTPITNLVPSNPTELFTAPNDNHTYAVDMAFTSTVESEDDGVTLSVYSAQLPIAPISPWSVRLFMGATELSVLNDNVPGYARVYKVETLSTSDTYRSRINLLTGQVTLYVVGTVDDLSMRLTSIQGYDSEKLVDVFVSYAGTNSLAKRREIRGALRSWNASFGVGQALYAEESTGVILSKANMTSVVELIDDVASVTRIAVGTPGNTENRVTVRESEIIRLGNVVINGLND